VSRNAYDIKQPRRISTINGQSEFSKMNMYVNMKQTKVISTDLQNKKVKKLAI